MDLPELQTADVGGPIAYREWDGPSSTTFVLVHGLGGSHLNWVQVAPGLAGLGRVIALDLPGFGRSPRAGRGSGLMDERRFLSAFIRERASGRVVLCGNSMGGAIGILQAAIEPSSIAGLVLTCSIFPLARGAWPHPLVVAAFAAYGTPRLGERVVTTRFRKMDPDQMVRASLAIVAAQASSIPEDIVGLQVDLILDRISDPDTVASFLEAARSLIRLGRRPDVAWRAIDAVRCPTLVLHGKLDRLVPVRYAEAALRRRPDWAKRLFPDLGHAPMMEAPGRWLTALADWEAEALG
jgi:pimeloyl-ACP methyl ester carboxylesterase